MANSLQTAVRRKEEAHKARDRRRGTRHHIAARIVQKRTQSQVLIRNPSGNKVDRRIDTDTESHRNHDHVVNADFAEFKRMRQEAKSSKRYQES